MPRRLQEIKDHEELCVETKKTSKKDMPNNVLFWRKKSPMPFSELILSWNASRPKQGSFLFYVNIKHHNWSGWKRIAEWGSTGQRTFGDNRNRYVHIQYVRAELKQKRVGFAYQIKVIAKNGADLRRLKALFVNVANERNFRIQREKITLPSTQITDIPRQSQFKVNHERNKDFCSPTSLSMISRYFMQKYSLPHKPSTLDEQALSLANKAYDPSLNIYGNWLFNVAQAYGVTRGNILYRVQRLNNFKALYEYLLKKIPVAVSVRGKLIGTKWPYNNGHFMVVVGWDKKKQRILCIDPAYRKKRRMVRGYPIKNFMKAWGKSRHLCYIPIPRKIPLADLTQE